MAEVSRARSHVFDGVAAGLLSGAVLGVLEVLASAYFGHAHLLLRWHWVTYLLASVGTAALLGAGLGLLLDTFVRQMMPAFARWVAPPWVRGLLLIGAVLAVCADATILVRLYSWLHVSLLLLAWVALFWATHSLASRLRAAAAVMIGGALAAVLAIVPLAGSLGPRRSIEERGGVVGMLLRVGHGSPKPVAFAPSKTLSPVAAPPPTPVAVRAAAQSVLVITVDALRADRFSPDKMPQTFAWANEHAVIFSSAFTPRPHTSHALSALFVGSDVPADLLAEDPLAFEDSLPHLLRRHDFMTLAFFPGAVFSVDKARFARIAGDSFGFEDPHVGFRSADEICAAGREALERMGDARYLLWLHLFDPHEPYELAAGESAALPMERYDLEVRRVDSAVARLLRSLPNPRPLVIFTADHGEEFGEHGGNYHGTTLYDEQVRIPLFVASPRVPAGKTSDAVGLSQLASFVAMSLGLNPASQMNTRSLPIPGEQTRPHHAFASLDGEEMIADSRYKLLCEPGAVECRLFDRHTNPKETELASNPAQFAAMLSALQAERQARAALLARTSGVPVELLAAEAGQMQAMPAVVALLGHRDVSLRMRAARVLGARLYRPATQTLRVAANTDLAMDVRLEAALSLARLDPLDLAFLRELFLRGDAGYDVALIRRAARFLAASGDSASVRALLGESIDEQADLEDRRRSIQLLGSLRARDARQALETLLEDHALRTDAATALGLLRDKRSIPALKTAFRAEIYPGAKLAEATALALLGDRAARRWLRTQASVAP